MEILKSSKKTLSQAVSIIKKGGVIICPTDTVYGFLADATNKKAVEKIYKIKKRPKSKPLPIFVKDLAMANRVAIIDERAKKFLLTPKVTVVLKLQPGAKLYGMAKDGTVALRIPKHAFLQQLLKKGNQPLSQTSVNVSGKETIKHIQDITTIFGQSKQIGAIIDGGSIKKSKPSKIVDVSNGAANILRK